MLFQVQKHEDIDHRPACAAPWFLWGTLKSTAALNTKISELYSPSLHWLEMGVSPNLTWQKTRIAMTMVNVHAGKGLGTPMKLLSGTFLWASDIRQGTWAKVICSILLLKSQWLRQEHKHAVSNQTLVLQTNGQSLSPITKFTAVCEVWRLPSPHSV